MLQPDEIYERYAAGLRRPRFDGDMPRLMMPGLLADPIEGFRAEGGPVKKKKPYVVGEKGPEVFVPETDGVIVPNDPRKAEVAVNDLEVDARPRTNRLPVAGVDDEFRGDTATGPTAPATQPKAPKYGGPASELNRMPRSPQEYLARINDRYGNLEKFATDDPVTAAGRLQPDTNATANTIEPDAPPPRPVYAPGKDPNKSRRENLKDEINATASAKVKGKRGFWNSLKGAGLGFLRAYAQSDPRMPFSQRIWSALGGGIGGGVASTIDPNLMAKAKRDAKLAELYDMYGQASAMEEADAKARKASLETEGARIKNINDRASDYLKVAMADNNIDDKEAAELSNLTGLPYNPADWRKRIRTSESGVPFIAIENEDASRVDTSRPINPTEVPKTRTIPGQGTFTVSDEKAFPVAGQVAVGNANRQQSASQFQVTQETRASEKTFDDEKDYEKELRARNNRVRSANAKLAAANKKVASYDAQLQAAQKEKADKAGYDTTEIDKRIADIESKKVAAEGDAAAAAIEKDEPEPKKAIRPKNPASSSSTKTYTENDIRARGKELNLTPARIEQKIKEARANGLIK